MEIIHSFLLFNKSMSSTFSVQGSAPSMKEIAVGRGGGEEEEKIPVLIELMVYCKDKRTKTSRQNPAPHIFL